MKVSHVLGVSLLLVGGAVGAHAMTSGSSRPALAAVGTSSTTAAAGSTPTVAPLALTDPSTTAAAPRSSGTVTTTVASRSARPAATIAAPVVTAATPGSSTSTSVRQTTTTVPRNYGSGLPPGSTAPMPHDTCTVSMESTPPAGLEATVGVHSGSLISVTMTVAGRPDATTHGTTNYQGTFATSFTARAGDPGTVTATLSRQGTTTGSCSANYTVR